jgi:hypothetical protein
MNNDTLRQQVKQAEQDSGIPFESQPVTPLEPAWIVIVLIAGALITLCTLWFILI